MDLLTVDNLYYKSDYGAVLNGISLSIKASTTVAILGKNGSGKSTLLNLIAGLLEPDSGDIIFEGEQVTGPSQKLVPGQVGISLVRQDSRLLPLYTVRENLRHILRSLATATQDSKIMELAELMGVSNNLDRKLKYLSGGEQQRVAIAAALASEPTLLLLDEPFSHTDIYSKEILKKHLAQAVSQLNISLLYVTHDATEALSLADEIMILEEGKILEAGSPYKVYYTPNFEATAALTGYYSWVSQDLIKDEHVYHIVNNKCLIRPDQIKISPSFQDNSIEAIIEQVDFYGYYQLIHLNSTGLKLIGVADSVNSILYTGKKVWISFKPLKDFI